MILERIVLNNFRCFYGECEIFFATDAEKNVTLIHAENGVGKTTLLNALLWCFYRKTTRRFERKDDIVNHQAVSEGVNIASVEVYFKHHGEEYVAKRHFNKNDLSTQNTLKVAGIQYGNQVPQTHTAPETFINSVIPKDMAGHFLFDGEHAEAISGEENRHDVGNAVRDILGCTLATKAVHDLENAYKTYRSQASSSSSGTEIISLQKKEESFSQQIEVAHSTIGELEKEFVVIKTQVSDINTELRNTAAVKETQIRKEALEHALKRAQKRSAQARHEMLSWLGDNGRFLVAKKITEETFACLDEETTKGKIPAPYNEDFVTSLLEKEICICGKPLEKGSEGAALVAELLNTASSKVLQDRIIKVRARLRGLRESRKQAPKRLINAHTTCSREESEISKLEGQIDECRTTIKNVNFEEIRAKVKKLDSLQEREREINQNIGGLKQNILRTEREQNDISRKIDGIVTKDAQAKKYVLRRDLASALKERLKSRLSEEEKSAKVVIRNIISKIISATTRKDFRVHMDDNFTVTLRNSEGITMAKSGGENQLLGLVFTAALCSFAKLRKNASGDFLLPGTEAPLVLDAPFGQLDDIYAVATAEFIPEMATQVILMVSKKQGSKDVLSKLRYRIGVENCIIRHNRAERGEKARENIDIGSERIETTIYESSFDGSVVKEFR